jgi:transketolase
MTTTTTTPAFLPSQAGLDTAAELAAQLRVDSIRASTSAGSGHPTSSMSAADLLAVLVTRHLHYDWDQPASPANDHLIFSKGHASPLLYAVFKAVGVVSEGEQMTGYRRFGQRLQGHPTPVLPWVDVATGSLGQGLADGVGIALAGKYLERESYRVWVLCGDSELTEGSIWEALDKAAHYRLSNLVAIVDVNRLGQRGATELGWDLDAYGRRVEAFGARPLVIDGHDLGAIGNALAEAVHPGDGQPSVILARTVKGKGFAEVEDRDGWHGKPFPPTWPSGRPPGSAASATCWFAARAPLPPWTGSQSRSRPTRRRRGTPSATRWPPARPTATRWSPSAPPTPGSLPWTPRWGTRPTPTSSRTPTRTGTSRCSSPSSSWWPPRPA